MSSAVIFPGQGSQRLGMARDFVEAFSESRAIFDLASEIIGEDLQIICFEQEDRLNRTEYTQPAIVTAEIAIFSAIERNSGFKPRYFAGHSLGEYSALVAAGAISFSNALKIVIKRGQLMQQAARSANGAMTALIGTDIASSQNLEVIKASGAEIASYNSYEQIVISGNKQSIEKAVSEIEKNSSDVICTPLNVSVAFHSSIMKVIEEEFRDYLELFSHSFCPSAAANVLSNYSGTFHSPDVLIDNMVSQISGSVRWIDNMKVLFEICDNILEVGPKRVLSQLFREAPIRISSVTDIRSYRKKYDEVEASCALY